MWLPNSQSRSVLLIRKNNLHDIINNFCIRMGIIVYVYFYKAAFYTNGSILKKKVFSYISINLTFCMFVHSLFIIFYQISDIFNTLVFLRKSTFICYLKCILTIACCFYVTENVLFIEYSLSLDLLTLFDSVFLFCFCQNKNIETESIWHSNIKYGYSMKQNMCEYIIILASFMVH